MPDFAVQVTLDARMEIPWSDVPADALDQLCAVVVATLEHVGLIGEFEIGLVVTDERRMRRINRQFRGIDQPTDVLSFPLSRAPLLSLPADQAWVERARGDDTHARPDLAPGEVPVPVLLGEEPLFTEEGPAHLGDIVFSAPSITRQAREAGHSVWWEWRFLTAHAVLHLIGYDDYYEAGYLAMVAHQNAVLHALEVHKEK